MNEFMKKAYIEFNVPVDEILLDENLKTDFANVYIDTVIEFVQEEENRDTEDICEELLRLRKLGQDKGGLPRIRKL